MKSFVREKPESDQKSDTLLESLAFFLFRLDPTFDPALLPAVLATWRCAFRRARARLASCPDQKVSPRILGAVRSSWTPR